MFRPVMRLATVGYRKMSQISEGAFGFVGLGMSQGHRVTPTCVVVMMGRAPVTTGVHASFPAGDTEAQLDGSITGGWSETEVCAGGCSADEARWAVTGTWTGVEPKLMGANVEMGVNAGVGTCNCI